MSTVPSVIGSTSRVDMNRLPRNLTRSLKAIGIDTSTLMRAAGMARRIVIHTESKMNGSLKNAT